MLILIVSIVAALLLTLGAVVLLVRATANANRRAQLESDRRRVAVQRFQAERQIDRLVHQAFSDMLEEGRRHRGGRP